MTATVHNADVFLTEQQSMGRKVRKFP